MIAVAEKITVALPTKKMLWVQNFVLKFAMMIDRLWHWPFDAAPKEKVLEEQNSS